MKPETKFYKALDWIGDTLGSYEEDIDGKLDELEETGTYSIEDHRELLFKHICYKMRLPYFVMFFYGLLGAGVDEKMAKRFATLVRGVKAGVTEEQCMRVTRGADPDLLEKSAHREIEERKTLFMNYVRRGLRRVELEEKGDAVMEAACSIFEFYKKLASLRLTAARFGHEITHNMQEFVTQLETGKPWEITRGDIKTTSIEGLEVILAIEDNHDTYLGDCEFLYDTYKRRETVERAQRKDEVKQMKKRLKVAKGDEAEMTQRFDSFAPRVGVHEVPNQIKNILKRLRMIDKRFRDMEPILEEIQKEVDVQPRYHG